MSVFGMAEKESRVARRGQQATGEFGEETQNGIQDMLENGQRYTHAAEKIKKKSADAGERQGTIQMYFVARELPSSSPRSEHKRRAFSSKGRGNTVDNWTPAHGLGLRSNCN